MICSSIFMGGGCEESTLEYGLETKTNKKKNKNRRRMTSREQQACKQKITNLLKKYGLNNNE